MKKKINWLNLTMYFKKKPKGWYLNPFKKEFNFSPLNREILWLDFIRKCEALKVGVE